MTYTVSSGTLNSTIPYHTYKENKLRWQYTPVPVALWAKRQKFNFRRLPAEISNQCPVVTDKGLAY